MTGAELREIRESFGLTQQQFGEAIGLEGTWCGSTIRKMELGTVRVSGLVARCAELMRDLRDCQTRRRIKRKK